MRVPKFHSRGIPRGHLFTLAFVNGFYGSPSARKKSLQKKDEAFFLLEFSRSKGFTQFMYSTVSANNHHLLAYSRGIDELDTLDFALLRGWHEDQIPPYAWTIYPERKIDWSSFDAEPKALSDYKRARRRLGFILYRLRAFLRIKANIPGAGAPLFRINDSTLPNPMEKPPEWKEISELASEHFESFKRR